MFKIDSVDAPAYLGEHFIQKFLLTNIALNLG
jgi:hypothetical protein